MREKWKKVLLALGLSLSLLLTGNLQYVQAEPESPGSAAGMIQGGKHTIYRLSHEVRFNGTTGHGFAAERGNNLMDAMKGKKATVVGDNNAKNGADRMIIGRGTGRQILIQDKYCKTARSTVEACFEQGKNGTQVFRYLDGKGKPMLIEVPADQYEDAVKIMEGKIKEGLIPKVKNPAEAKNLVKKGSLTYQQAVNLTKAGTIDSLKYDAANGVISASCAFGIAALLDYSVSMLNGADREEALQTAVLNGFKTGVVVFATDVIAGQIAKTGAGQVFVPTANAVTKALGPGFSKAILAAYDPAAGALAKNSSALTTKAGAVLGKQMLVATVLIVVLTADDVADLFQGRISREQLLKNLAITTAGVVGGTAGFAAGAAVGSAVAPGAGTIVGGLAGSTALGTASGFATEKAMHIFMEDDADKMLACLEEEFQNLGEEYLINIEEGEQITEKLQKELSGDRLKDMFASEDPKAYARDLMEPMFEETLTTREKITAPTEQEMRSEMKTSMEDVVFLH